MSEDSKKINQVPVSPPGDVDKPFFTYGIFKKGQIAHSKIADLVEHVDDDAEIRDCKLKIRDGIPVISDKNDEGFNTKGQIIYFHEGDEEAAYGIISDTEPDDLYEWGNATVKGIDVNVLYGKNLNNGSFSYEYDNGRYADDFNGKDDLFFSDLLEFLGSEHKNLGGDENDIFRLQMCYMILWSAIDRYCSLKYDSINFKGDDIWNMSQDPVFIESINECNPPYRKPIHSSRDAKPWKWKNTPYSKLMFYYRLRGNVVHRGKDRHTNIGVLGQCLKELLEIFDKAIDKTFYHETD